MRLYVDRNNDPASTNTDQFETHLMTFYPLVTDLVAKEQAPEMRLAARDFFHRIGTSKGYIVSTEEEKMT